METLTASGFLARLLAALVLVIATFNPSGLSYVHWIRDGFPELTPAKAIAGIALLIGWGMFVHATRRSIGGTGVLLIAALFAALVWLLVSWGWLSLERTRALVWVGLVMVSFILAVGMSWSLVRRRLSGQADVDDVDEG